MTRDRCDIHRQFKAVDDAYRRGDLRALKAALGDPPDFPNCLQPFDLAVGDYPLEYAIYWSPFAFVVELLALGANASYPDQSGFPSLIATLSTTRADRHRILELLLANGAQVDQRGVNDYTPLHYAVALRDLRAIEILLAHGADPLLRTRIDDCSTPLEDATSIGFPEAVDLLRKAATHSRERSE